MVKKDATRHFKQDRRWEEILGKLGAALTKTQLTLLNK